MNIYVINGEESDGSHMSIYADISIVAAENEADALTFACGDGLLGSAKNWKIRNVGIAGHDIPAGSIDRSYCRDY